MSTLFNQGGTVHAIRHDGDALLDDFAAVAALKRGDISALDVLVLRYQTKAARVAYLVTHNHGLADDVMQTAFVRFYEHLHHFDPTRPFEPYFMRMVLNLALKSVGRDRVTLPLDMTAEWLPDFSPDPSRIVETAETEAAIRNALDALSPEQRAVIVLRYYLGYTEQEISAEMGNPVGTVRWRIHAARKRLRGLLAHIGGKTAAEGGDA